MYICFTKVLRIKQEYNGDIQNMRTGAPEARRWQIPRINPRYFRSLNFTPSAGDLCHLVDADSNLDASVRIVAVEYSPVEPWALKLTLSDKIPVSVSSLIKREVKQTTHALEVVDRRQEFNSRKNAKALNELANFLLDADGNFDEELITARLVRARQYEGGNPSQDFSMQNITVTPAVSAISVSAGSLTHNTYEVAGVGSTWTITARTFADLDPDKAYYLYAKCSKMVLDGTFEISTDEELSVDQFSDEGFWVFNLGVLFKVRQEEDFRDFVATYGMFRQIGGQIIGSSLSSIDGFNVWNLDGGRFRVGTLDSYFDFNLSERNQLTLYNAKLISCTGNQKGDKGDYIRYVYKWTDSPTPPTPPVGSDPDGWTWNNLRGRVITDHQGQIMTDQDGRMICAPYPASYRLWTSVAYFSGVDNTLIGMWSTPFVQSGADGLDGRPGKDVDPAVLLDLQQTAKAIKDNFTSVQGGLVLTTLIKLLNNGIETAGVSGLNAEGGLPAFWAGGTYAEAITNKANVVINHNGQAKVGAMYIDKGETIKMYEGDDLRDEMCRVLITKGDISPLSQFKGDNESGSAVNNSVFYSKNSSFDRKLSNTIVISKANINLNIAGTISAFARVFEPRDYADAMITAWLTKNGENYIRLADAFANASFNEGGVASQSNDVNLDQTITVSQGTYGLRIEGTTSCLGSRRAVGSASISDSLMIYNFIASVKRLEIGANGICSYISSDKYLYLAQNGNDDTFMEVKGKTDMPGVLAKARVTSYGTVDRQWGAYTMSRVEGISGSAANKRVWHNFPKAGYTAIATPIGGQGAIANVIEEYPNYVEIYATGAFNIILIGDNA